jgi:RNA polymerase sigma factor (sigma-70 family)
MGSDRGGRRRSGSAGAAVDPEQGGGALTPEALYAWFFRAEYPQVVRTVSLVLRDAVAAEDVAQEAFLRLHLHWAKVYRYDRPDAWVRRVALNLAASRTRREGRRARLERLSGGAWSASTDDAGALEGRHERVQDALLTLSHKQRALVVLYYYEDRPLSEAGELLGLTPGSAKVALHRARKRLHLMLGAGDTADADGAGHVREAGDV